MRKELLVKVEALFDQLEEALDCQSYEQADIIASKLSKYFHLFDDELTDYYQYAIDVIDINLYPENSDWYTFEDEFLGGDFTQ